jgi:hypothetical protein
MEDVNFEEFKKKDFLVKTNLINICQNFKVVTTLSSGADLAGQIRTRQLPNYFLSTQFDFNAFILASLESRSKMVADRISIQALSIVNAMLCS